MDTRTNRKPMQLNEWCGTGFALELSEDFKQSIFQIESLTEK